LKSFLELLNALVAGYVLNGWPFLIAHLFVAYWVKNSWSQISSERDALERWHVPPAEVAVSDVTPEGEEATGAKPNKLFLRTKPPQAIVVLEQFIQESRIMGAKGVIVPMTDFSDRLDSAVEGKIAELHDRTNLFLYVGIAGTMFGVFEFAFRSYDTLVQAGLDPSIKVAKLAEYLSGSMSKAFPVGFFGLVFTFAAQIFATWPEQRLREQLSEAVRKALETRQHAIHSQAELLQRAASSIETATEPLRDLKKTLSEGLQPLVEVFGQRLDKTLELVQGHFETVQQTSTGLESAVESLRQAVDSIAGATLSLQSLIKDTPRIINRLVELEKKHERSLDKVDKLFTEHFQQAERVSQALGASVSELSALSQRILADASEGIRRVEEAATSDWTNATDNLRLKIESDLALVFGDLDKRAAELTETVKAAIETINQVAHASEASLFAISEIAPKISEGYKGSLEKVGTESIAHWKAMTDKFGGGSERAYQGYIDKVKQGTMESSGALTEAARAWDSVARNAPKVLREPIEAAVAEARKDLVEKLRSFDTDLAGRITQFSAELTELQRSTGELVMKVGSINNGLRAWAEQAGPLTREIKAVSEGIRQQNEIQTALVTRLDGTTERIERASIRLSNLRATRTPSNPQGKTDDAAPPPESKWWKPLSWETWRRRR